MFLCQPLLEVLAGRGIEDIDAFLKVPSWNDLPDPFSIPSMEKATARVLRGIRNSERITIHGDYDCDGVLGTHILRGVITGLGAAPRPYLPHRDEGYGLNSSAVHHFSRRGTDLLITVDNGINARAAVQLAQRLGIDVVVIDHHRIQEQAETTAVWSEEFCGAGLAAMFAWALALRAGWNDAKVERLLSGCSQYAAIASIADCVPLLRGTRTLARLGLAELSRSRHKGLQELLKSACTDPSQPDSRDVAFGVAPRINAAGRMADPAKALAVFEAALDEEAARQAVNRLNHLNLERQRTVKLHFEQLVESIGANTSAGLVVLRERSPKGIAGLLASKCVERYSVPSIVLVPSTIPGQLVGSGRSVPGVDLVETLRPHRELFVRFGGHAQAIGLTMAVDRIDEFRGVSVRTGRFSTTLGPTRPSSPPASRSRSRWIWSRDIGRDEEGARRAGVHNFDERNAFEDPADPRDTPLGHHAVAKILPALESSATPWLDGIDRLEDPSGLPRFVASRIAYRRVVRWLWWLLVPIAVALFGRLPDYWVFGMPKLEPFSSRLLGLGLTLVARVIVAGVVLGVVNHRVWHSAGRSLLGPPAHRANDTAREATRPILAEGGVGLVTGHTLQPELARVGSGFYANAGACGEVVEGKSLRLAFPRCSSTSTRSPGSRSRRGCRCTRGSSSPAGTCGPSPSSNASRPQGCPGTRVSRRSSPPTPEVPAGRPSSTRRARCGVCGASPRPASPSSAWPDSSSRRSCRLSCGASSTPCSATSPSA